MVAEERKGGDVAVSLFLLDELISKVKLSEKDVLNGYEQLPKDVKEIDIFSKYTDNPSNYEILSWRQWGVYDEADNEGRFGEGTKAVLMPTITIEKEGYSILLGVTGGITGKELHYHVTKIK